MSKIKIKYFKQIKKKAYLKTSKLKRPSKIEFNTQNMNLKQINNVKNTLKNKERFTDLQVNKHLDKRYKY